MDREAFFISPKGQVHFVPGRHIELVCSEPGTFGLAKEDLERVFSKYGENWSTEGIARQEILAGLLKQGWIRIRVRSEQKRGPVCLFQLSDLDENARARILAFSREITSGGVEGVRLAPYTLATIKLVSGEEITDGWTTLGQIAQENSW